MSKKMKALVIYWLFLLVLATLPTTYAWFIISGPRVSGLSGTVKESIDSPVNVQTEVAYVDLYDDLVFDVSGTLNQMASARIIERTRSNFGNGSELSMVNNDTGNSIDLSDFIYLIIPNFAVTNETGSVLFQEDVFPDELLPNIGPFGEGNEAIKNYNFYLMLQEIFKYYLTGKWIMPVYEQETKSLYTYVMDGKFGYGLDFDWTTWFAYYEKYGNSAQFTMYRYQDPQNGGEWTKWSDQAPQRYFKGTNHIDAIANYNTEAIKQMKERTDENIHFAIVMWALYPQSGNLDPSKGGLNPYPKTKIVDFKVQFS